MAMSPEYAERLAGGLRVTMTNLEGIILERLAKRLGTGISSPSYQSDKLAQVQALKNEISTIVTEFTGGMNKYVEEVVFQAFEDGIKSADADFDEANLPIVKTQIETATAPINRLAISALVAEATGAISNTNFHILRKVEDVYRQTIARTATSAIAGIETKLQVVQRSINEFADAGITGFVDKAGRNWSIGAYTDMAVRSAIGRASMAGHEMRLTDLGEDLVIVSQHPDECPLCRKWEGQVLSISGTHPTYKSLKEAKSAGLFHQNCGHVATAYFEGYTNPMPKKMGSPADYEAKQKQRAIERQIRKWKNRQAVALTDQEKRLADTKVKEWQGAMRDFITKSGRRRKPERERINFGAKPNPNQFKTQPLPTQINDTPPVRPAMDGGNGAGGAVVSKPTYKTPEELAEEQKKADVAEFSTRIAQTQAMAKSGGQAYVDELAQRFGDADEDIRRVFLNWYDSKYITDSNYTGGCHWSPYFEKVSMDFKEDSQWSASGWGKSNGTTFFHEVGHLVDNISAKKLMSSGVISHPAGLTYDVMYCKVSDVARKDLIMQTIKDEANAMVGIIKDAVKNEKENEFREKIVKRIEFLKSEITDAEETIERYKKAMKKMKDENLETLDGYRYHHYSILIGEREDRIREWLKEIPKKTASQKQIDAFIEKKLDKMIENEVESRLQTLTAQAGMNGVSDLISGALVNKYDVTWSHKTKYWKDEPEKLITEAFAHIFQSQFDKTSKEKLQKYFPKAYQMLLDIMKKEMS